MKWTQQTSESLFFCDKNILSYILGCLGCWKIILIYTLKWYNLNKINMCVNSRVTTNLRHGSFLHRICPKILTRVPDVCPLNDAETIDSIPSRLESQTSVRRPILKIFGSSPSCLSFDQRRNCRLTSHPSVLRPLQPLTTHVLDIYPPNVTETKMSPFFCTAQN